MNPFEIELDRAEFDFMCAGAKNTKQYIKKERFKAGQVDPFFIEGEISSPKADQIARLHDQNRSSISLYCEFNCGLHDFSKTRNNLDGVNVHFLNVQDRRQRLEHA